MWRVGQDATLRMTLGALIVDRPPTQEALLERLTFAASQAPRLRQRPDDPTAVRPARRGSTTTISPEPHLRTSVAARVDAVLDLVGLLEAIPFDPQRSPWDVTLIEGLEGGRAALYLRSHHALTDGAGLRLVGLLLDEPSWPRVEERPRKKRAAPVAAVASTDGERTRGTITITIDVGSRCAGSSTASTHATSRPSNPPGCAALARSGQQRLAPAHGDRRSAGSTAVEPFAAQPLRGSRSTAPGQPRWPWGAATTSSPPPPRWPRPLSREARDTDRRAAAGDADGPGPRRRDRRELVRTCSARGAHRRGPSGTAVRRRRRAAGPGPP